MKTPGTATTEKERDEAYESAFDLYRQNASDYRRNGKFWADCAQAFFKQ
jgi:hypothetical protein